MKKLIVAVIALSSMVACKSEKKEKVEVKEEVKVEKVVVTNNVNIEASVLTWKGTKASGESHNGTVALKEGSLAIENGKVSGGEFVVDMNSIANLDVESEKYRAKLVGHLKNADFFDVEKFPTSKFVITSVEDKEGKLAVTGNLTIKDVTKSITIPATLTTEEGVSTFKSDVFHVDRADFNVKYGSKKWFDNLKDKFIKDLVEFSFEVKTKA